MNGENKEGLITESQRKYLNILRSNTSAEKWREILEKNKLNTDLKIEDLTKEEASILIEQLKGGEKKESFRDKMKDYIDFEQLLKEAHKKFKDRLNIITELIEVSEKRAIFKAKVVIKGNGKKEQTFVSYGDATLENTNQMVRPHYIRVAETRAIVRSLRTCLGVGMTAKEELE